jgi:hypothetical protein
MRVWSALTELHRSRLPPSPGSVGAAPWPDWRGETLGIMRKLIKEADPDVVEEWKWMGTPVWSHDGIICTGESYKNVVKLTFAKGASLKDRARLFNWSLDGNVRRGSTSTKEKKLTSPPLRRSFAKRSPQQFCQVETFEESEVLRDSAPEPVRHRASSVKLRQLPHNNSFKPNPLRGSA